MKLANEDVGMLAFMSEQILAPLLLPEIVLLWNHILNYTLHNHQLMSNEMIFILFRWKGWRAEHVKLLPLATCWSPEEIVDR
jgi:hypothetical protein